MKGERFTLTLRPVPPGRDHLGREPIYRLRLALRRLLRDHGLRCERIEHAAILPPVDDPDNPGHKEVSDTDA